jgi:hypothetical protein
MTNAIAQFWTSFARRAAELAAAGSADSPVYDELLDELQAIDGGLYIEFSASARELVITAEGERALFPLVHEIVAAAPSVPGWTVRALKPKLGFPEKVRWNELELAIDAMVFDPLEAAGSDELGLRILIPGIDEEDLEDAHNAVLRAIDHGLGERKFAEAVAHTEVAPLAPDQDPADFIPLRALERYVDWRERRRTTAN